MFFVLCTVFSICKEEYTEEITKEEAKERIIGTFKVAWLRFIYGIKNAFNPIVKPFSGPLNVQKWVGRVIVEMDEIRIQGVKNWINFLMSISRKFLFEKSKIYNEAMIKMANDANVKAEAATVEVTTVADRKSVVNPETNKKSSEL